MTEGQIRLSREQLYNEIWTISVSGVAKKYNVPYAKLLKLCKEIDIPYPPSGYWTQLKCGKAVTKTSLPESLTTEVTLPASFSPKRSPKCVPQPTTVTKTNEDNSVVANPDSKIKISEGNKLPGREQAVEVQDAAIDNQAIYRAVDGKQNIYNRERLYEDVWAKPVTHVAIQYGVSDVAIHKICKSLNVPVPPRGYWSKIRAGATPPKPPLPKTKGNTEVVGKRTFEGVKVSDALSQPLEFLPEDERQQVFLAAQQIKISPDNKRLHKRIISYRSVVKEWNKKDRKPEGAQRSFKNYLSVRPPFLAGVISDATLPRVYRILDALFRRIESLGGSINDDLSLLIRNEHVQIEVFEGQDRAKHQITREEAKELLIYEDAQRHNSWGSKPNIRKYDYIFNGKLKICVHKGRYFRDTDTVNIESMLGEMLIELYEESEVVRLDREAREEAKRKREEEERLRQERQERYNAEVERTIALTNMAEDYDTACKIRAFITALETKRNVDEETSSLIDWAKRKADWFDPIIARTDELLGDRDHGKNADEKTIKKHRGYW